MGWEIDNYLRKNPEEKGRYKAMNVAQREDFRVMWCNTKGEVIDKQLVAMRTFTQEDSSVGKMMSARKIAMELGGDTQAALRYCRSCLKLGPSEWMIEDSSLDLDLAAWLTSTSSRGWAS